MCGAPLIIQSQVLLFMAQAMPSHASAAHLWLLSTLSCPASSVLLLVMSFIIVFHDQFTPRFRFSQNSVLLARGRRRGRTEPSSPVSGVHSQTCQFSVGSTAAIFIVSLSKFFIIFS